MFHLAGFNVCSVRSLNLIGLWNLGPGQAFDRLGREIKPSHLPYIKSGEHPSKLIFFIFFCRFFLCVWRYAIKEHPAYNLLCPLFCRPCYCRHLYLSKYKGFVIFIYLSSFFLFTNFLLVIVWSLNICPITHFAHQWCFCFLWMLSFLFLLFSGLWKCVVTVYYTVREHSIITVNRRITNRTL